MWFYFDGTDLTVYSVPTAAKVKHIRNHPQVSLNLDSDGNGGGIVVVGGTAAVDSEGVDPHDDGPYWAKYGDVVAKFGMDEAMAAYSTRIKITPTRVWTSRASRRRKCIPRRNCGVSRRQLHCPQAANERAT
ncbi:MAG: hypothetical protein JWR37_3063 [Mycobacterium sp.]|nr:hypothetical protein [Mycobacterium sp.]